MGSALLQRIRGLLQPAPHVAMKDPAFGWHFDDLGQYEGDLERKVRPGAPSPPPELADDEIAAHVEHDQLRA